MNYKDVLIPELKHLQAKRNAVISLEHKIAIIKLKAEQLKAMSYDKDRVQDSGCSKEDELIDNIAERGMLEEQLRIIREEIEWLEDGLALLSPEQQLILNWMLIQHRRYADADLADALHCEVATVYRKRNAALADLARNLYGKVEI